jgi:hypothetical protein
MSSAWHVATAAREPGPAAGQARLPSWMGSEPGITLFNTK